MSELEGSADHVIVTGRGQVIADTSVADLIGTASGRRVTLRTTAPADAMTVLTGAGAQVTAAGSGVLRVTGVTAEQTVAVLTGHALPFSEVSAHRATLEEAYLELTRGAVEFRAEEAS